MCTIPPPSSATTSVTPITPSSPSSGVVGFAQIELRDWFVCCYRSQGRSSCAPRFFECTGNLLPGYYKSHYGNLCSCNYHDVDLVNPYADFDVNKKYWWNQKQRRVAGYVGFVGTTSHSASLVALTCTYLLDFEAFRAFLSAVRLLLFKDGQH